MRKKFPKSALVSLLLLASAFAILPAQRFGEFDRVAVVEHFLDAVYPDLKHVYGLVLSRSEEFHLSNADGLSAQQIDIAPCRPGSGVPGAGQKMTIPHCTGLFLPSFSEFLTISVGYSARFPIKGFRARGSFVDGKSQAAKREIWDHPEWERPEWMEAVLRAKPRFGPAQKRDLLHSIPEQTLKAIRTFTGCQLDLDTASFWVNRLGHKPDNMNVEIQWMVQGHESSKGATVNSCSADFEPFEGKLLSVQ